MKPNVGGVRLKTMRVLQWFMVFAFAAGTAAAKYELQQPIPEVKLKDGTVLHAVTFVSVGGASITGKWDGGRGSIPLAQLPDDIRADLVPPAPVVSATPAAPEAASPAAIPPGATAPAPASKPAPAPAGALSKLPTDIKLTNGFVMHEAKVLSWTPDSMMVNYVGGKVSVKLENIAPEQRMIFEAHRIQVYARAERIKNATKAQRKGLAAPTEVSEDEIRALIEAGISAHQLVRGMTMDDVMQAIGAPAKSVLYPDTPDYVYWLYPGGGRDAKGAACDRAVGFNKGIVDSWHDE